MGYDDSVEPESDGEKIARMSLITQEAMPKIWHGLYANMLKEGFPKDVALEILKTYVIGNTLNGVKCI